MSGCISNPAMLSPYFDWKVTQTSAVLASYVKVLSYDPYRIAIIFSADVTNPGTVKFNPKPGTITEFGIVLRQENPNFDISMPTHGGLTQSEWYTSAGGGGAAAVTII